MAVRLYGRATISCGTIPFDYMAVRLYGRFENSPDLAIFFDYMAAKRPIFFRNLIRIGVFSVLWPFRGRFLQNSSGFFRFYGRFAADFYENPTDFFRFYGRNVRGNSSKIHAWLRKILEKIDENPSNFRFYGRFEKLGKSIREARFLSVIWPFGYMAEKSRFWTDPAFRSIIWPAI